MKSRKIVYIDMDEVLVDFHSHPTLKVGRDTYNHPHIYNIGYFRHLKPIEGSIDGVKRLVNDPSLDVYIATHPLYNSPHCYSEKIEWLQEYLPELVRNVIMTCDKGLLIGDYLVDDSIKWYGPFKGEFILFDPLVEDHNKQWLDIYNKITGGN